MQKLLALVLSGAVTGAIYSIMASGLVLTYTTSGIFNFAHGAVAFSVAYLYYQLHSGVGVPIVPSLIVSVFVFAPLLGLLLDRLILRRLAAAPVYARVVGTIGLLVALPNLVQWLVVAVGNGVFHLGLLGNTATVQGAVAPGVGPSPAHVYHLLARVALNSDQLAVFIVTATSAAGMWYVLRHTRIGLDMRAVVDRRSLAGLRGINAARTSATAWVLTMLLAGFGGVLISPLFNLNSDIFTLVVLGSLAAVVLGGLRSLPIAFAGGLGLGVVQNLVAGYTTVMPSWIANLTGLRSVIPYVLVLLLGLFFGRDRSRQAGTVAEERFPVDHRVGMSTLRRRLPWVLATVALIAYSLQWIHMSGLRASSYDQTVIAQSLAVAIIILSFVIVTGMGGMVSLAQPTFVTAGGFAAGWALNRDWGVDIPLIATHGRINFFWASLIAVVVGAALGALVALPATRLGAVYLAIWSLAAAFFFSLVPFAYQSIGHGQGGWSIPSPSLSIPGINWVHRFLVRDGGHFDFGQLPDQIVLFLAVFGLVTAVIHALMRSVTGRAILAVRSSPTAAEASGIRANRTRLVIFALSAAIAALGGVMLSLFSLSASNSIAPPQVGLIWLALAVLFGVRRPGGALLAGFGVAASTAILHFLASPLPGATVKQLITSVYFVPILSGLGAIQLAMEPDGILTYTGQRSVARRRAKARSAGLEEAEAVLRADGVGATSRPSRAAKPTPDTAVLGARGVEAGYGDIEVLHGVDLAIERGRIVALLGANGAGKSTLCAVLAGTLAPSGGTVVLHGQDVTALPTHARARRGLLLVPEARGIFPGLSVEENLAVLLPKAVDREKAYVRFPVLSERRRQSAGLLSGGEQQMLSMAPALAQPPAVLIADEPTLGLAPLAAASVMDAVIELKDEGTAILLVEELASNALQVADTIALMELGRIVWAGPRQEADLDRLGSAYLGAEPRGSGAARATIE